MFTNTITIIIAINYYNQKQEGALQDYLTTATVAVGKCKEFLKTYEVVSEAARTGERGPEMAWTWADENDDMIRCDVEQAESDVKALLSLQSMLSNTEALPPPLLGQSYVHMGRGP